MHLSIHLLVRGVQTPSSSQHVVVYPQKGSPRIHIKHRVLTPRFLVVMPWLGKEKNQNNRKGAGDDGSGTLKGELLGRGLRWGLCWGVER